jgi:hypothetical protein
LKSQNASLAINANITVAIWRNQERVVASALVLGLLCPSFKSPVTDCQVVLATTTAEAQALSQNKGELLLLPTMPLERKQ